MIHFYYKICYCINMKKIKLKNIVWKEEKYYISQCLNIDISSFGKTKKEALDNLYEAIDLYFEDIKKIEFQEVKNPEFFTLNFNYA